MTNSVPTPPRLAKAKAAAVTAAAVAATAALTIGGTTAASSAVLADRDQAVSTSLSQDVSLSASTGVYPTGPLFQAARLLGLGSPDAALNSLQTLASLIGQGDLAATIGTIRNVLAGLPDFVDIGVPGFGPAGIIDAAGSLEGDAATQLLLTTLKTALLNAENVAALEPILAGLGLDLPPELGQYLGLLANLPLNVPGTSLVAESGALNDIIEVIFPGFDGLSVGAFLSDADKLAIIPAFGLGGTNFALASPTFLNDPEFAKTAVLGILIRNTSRPGGGIVAMLNPFSQLVGLNLANMDGRGDPQTTTTDITIPSPLPWLIPDIPLASIDVTEYDGNLTVWDITAAYDLLSDAPSTIYNPLAWANSAVGFAMPTYLIPSTITQILDGDVLDGLIDSLGMIKIDVSDHDGNLYITYDSGNLPLLEPVQFLPRTLSYFPGFDISTPVSSSFEQVLRTLVATGYQDVQVTDEDGDGVYSFVRDFKMGGSQAYFWENPINFTQGLEVPQTVLNELVSGLSNNLLNPEGNSLELFGDNTLTDLLYNNDLAIPLAKFIRDTLNQVMDAVNPIINDIQEPLKEVTKLLDDAQEQVNTFIRDGLKAGAADPIVDLEGPLLDANRFVNDLTGPLDNGILNAPGNASDIGTVLASREGAPSESENADETGLPANSSLAAEAEVEETEEALSTGTDFLADTVIAERAEKVADALNPRKALQAAADEAGDRAEKRVTKTQNSLRKANERAALVGKELREGDVAGAAKQVGANVQNRVDRLKKDVNNGLSKLRGSHKDSDNGSDKSANKDTKSEKKRESKKDAA